MDNRTRDLRSFTMVLFVILAARLIFLQLIMHNYYTERSYDQRLRMITLSPDRGDIYDRDGGILATSIYAYSVFANPPEVKDKLATAALLAKILGESKASMLDKLTSNKPFVWIKRKIEEPVATKVKQRDLPGIGLLSEKKRVYPKKKLAAQVIGFVGMDNQGLAGIEISYERYLKGEGGQLTTERDLRGRDILTSNLRVLKEPTDGMNLTLTIDESIQYQAEEAIRNAVKTSNANSGCVIVMDIKSGDILALASYPDFDPNDYQKSGERSWNNHAITDVYEPGSTFKLVTVAGGIEDGIINKNSTIYCPDSIKIGGRVIKNSHTLKFNSHYLTIKEILRESVNTGAVDIAEKMGKDRFYRLVKGFGFGDYTGVGLMGESRGIFPEPDKWNKPDLATMSFGQSIAVTPIQLIASLSSIANKGERVRPRLVRKIESVNSDFLKIFAPELRGQAISPKTARDVLELTEDVVENGTGRLAKIPLFRVGGKTGTAQKAKPGGGGYMEGHYVSSFIGFVPLSDPRLSVLVVVDDPKHGYWGERVASPVFKDVAGFALRKMNIAPDKKESSVL